MVDEDGYLDFEKLKEYVEKERPAGYEIHVRDFFDTYNDVIDWDEFYRWMDENKDKEGFEWLYKLLIMKAEDLLPPEWTDENGVLNLDYVHEPESGVKPDKSNADQKLEDLDWDWWELTQFWNAAKDKKPERWIKDFFNVLITNDDDKISWQEVAKVINPTAFDENHYEGMLFYLENNAFHINWEEFYDWVDEVEALDGFEWVVPLVAQLEREMPGMIADEMAGYLEYFGIEASDEELEEDWPI